ncbi:immunoglobulin-like and fibronectin type III domain-containing protein 1 isoform X2 [Anser cygnoides]|uniref:immunoglobulin-like and fibronectin type III domain-containing protein 1 isoform X2 n=1 Tax=Anser cygnoides TaxID=8845 RepID=UPI0034D36A5F
MTSHPAVKSYKKSSVPGVNIAQFVDKIPEGCSTPDFERKPVTLTLQEGKNAIFRAVVKGVPTPEVKWRRAKGEMDDPGKYEIFFNKVINEYVLKINKLTVDDTDVYRCFAVNEYGEATCSAGLRIIQVGFKRKAQYVPAQSADELKKKLQDLRKLLRKRAPVPKQKTLDKEAIFQLLLHADRRDYEKICIKYGISDFRGMLRKLQEMRRDAESEQGELIHSIRNMQHIKVNKDGTATFVLEMDLKNSNSKIYLLKDGERLRYGTGDEYRKHYLRRIGKRYNFIVNDVQPEDAGLYQVRVEDVPVFSTELDAESIPVRFQQPLSDVRCPEKGNAVFECTLRSPCYDAVWLHKTHPLEASEKHQISMTPDGMTHQLVIKDVVASDNGMYTLDTGLCSSNAYLLVEYPKGKKGQDEGGEKEKSDWRKETLTDKDGAKKPKCREHLSDKDHLTDAGMEKDDWYRNGQEGSQGYSTDADEGYIFLGKEGLRKTYRDGTMGPGQFSGAEGDGESMTDDDSNIGLKILGGKKGLRLVHSQDSMTGRANTDDRAGGADEWCSVDGRDEGMLDAVDVDMADAEGMDSWHDKNDKVGDNSSRAGFGGIKRLGATDGSSVLGGLDPDSTRVGDKHSLYGKDDMLGRTRSGKNAAGTETAGGMRSPYSKDGLPTVAGVNGVGIKREGETGALYGKDGLTVDAGGHVGQAGRSGLLYGPGGLPAGDGARTGAGGSSAGEMGVLYGPDGLPVGADVNDATAGKMGGFYGKHGQSGEAGAGAGNWVRADGAGRQMGSPYQKDSLPAGAGAGIGGAGAGGFGGVGSPYGKDGLPAGAGVGGAGVGGLGGVGSPYGKDGLPAGSGVGGAGVGGLGGVGSPYGKDGLPAGAGAGVGVGGAGVGGFGGVGSPYGKDGLPMGMGTGAGIGGTGVDGFGGVGSPYGKDGLPAGAGVGAAGAGGIGSPYGKDGLLVGMGPGASGTSVDGFGGVGSPYGKDGLPAGVGIGGAGGIGSPYGKDGLPVGMGTGAGIGGAGVGGLGGAGSPYGKDGLPAGAGVDGSGLAGAGGVGSPYGKDGLPAGAGVGGAGAGGFGGAGSPYGKDGLPAGAGTVAGGAGVGGFGGVGSPYGKDGLPVRMGPGAGGAGAGGAEGDGSPYGKDGLPAGAGAGGAGVGGFGGVGSPYGKDGLPAGAGVGGAGVGGLGGVVSPYGKDGLQAGVGGAGAGGAGGVGSPYGKDGLPAGAGVGGAGAGGFGGVGSPYGKDGLPAGAGAGIGGAGVGGLGGVGSPYGKDGLPAGAGAGIGGAGVGGLGGVGSPYGKDGLPVGMGPGAGGAGAGGAEGNGSPYGKDGLPAGAGAGVGGAGVGVFGGVGSPYGKDGLPAGAGVGGAGAGGLGGVGSPYGKDGLPAGAGVGGAGVGGLGGVGSPYGKDGLPAGAGVGGAGVGGLGGVGSPYGKDGLPAGVGGAGAGGAAGIGSPYGKDGLPAGAGVGGLGGVGSPYGKDGLPAGAGAGIGGAGAGGLGGVGSPYGKDGLPAGAGAGIGGAGAGGLGGVGSPYGKDGLPAGAGAGIGGAGVGGFGGVGSPYGKDGLPAGAGVGGAGVGGLGGVGSPYGKDGLPDGAGAGVGGAGAGGFGGAGSPYGKDGLPAGAGVGGSGLAGAGGVGSPYGKDGFPAGAGVGGAGVAGLGGVGSPYGKGGLPVGMGTGAGVGGAGAGGFGGVGSPYGKDGLPAGAGGSITSARGAGSSYGRDGLSSGAAAGVAHFPFGGEEVMGSHHGRDAGLSSVQGYGGGAGGAGLSSEGRGVGGSAIQGAGSAYGKDGGSAGGRAGGGGVGRLGGDGKELHSAWGTEGMAGAVGMGGKYGLDSRVGKSARDEAGKGTAGDFRGPGHKGSSHDEESDQRDGRGEDRDLGQLGSRYGKDSAVGGAGDKSPNRLGDGRKPGVFSQGSPGYDQTSNLYGGPSSINQRKQLPSLDIKTNDFLKNAESTERRGHFRLDDLRAPRCHVNKQLIDVRVQKGEPAELSCAVNKEDVTATWFKDGLKLTSMDGVFFEKQGLVHKLIFSKVEDIHAGKYRFEAGDIKIEASVFVEDPPQVDKVLLKNLTSVPTVAKAGEKIKIKVPFEGRLPVRATWLKDKMELADDSRIRVDKTDTYTMLSISNTERKDRGDYKVRLKNDSGILDIDLKVEVTDKPQPPAGPMKIVESSANDITIQWKPPKDDGGKPVQSYIVERQQVGEGGEGDWVALGEIPRSCTTFTTNKVERDMSYYFRVRAVNAEGTSDALESEEVKAVSKATPGAPDPPEIISVSKDTITISWKTPRRTGSSRIVGYIVQKRKKGTMTWVPVNSVPIADKKLKMTNLKKGLQYEFCVAAVNASGVGDISAPSQPVFARDSTKPPGQVRDLAVTSSDSTSVTLSWKRPEAKDGIDVKGYDVEIRSSNNLDWTRCNVLPIGVTTYTVKGLKNKELYFLRVRALNDCGPGEAAELEAFTEADSNVVSPRFLIDDTVKNFLIIKAGNTIRVDIPFEASPDPQVSWLKDGLPLSNRATISTKDGTSQLLIKAAELIDSGTYTIELKNESGKRETFSFQVQVTDIPQNPGPILLQENVPNAVTVTWEPSASEKWESNLYYTVLKRESQKGLWHVVGDLIYTNKFTYTKVIPGRDYYFRVVAKNELGSSGPSETVQPWRIKKTKAEVHIRPQKYRGVNQNQPPRFLVPLKPHVVTTGSECRMSCAVAGHPPPKITWYKNSRDLSSDPAYFGTNDFGVCSLVIQGVSKADEGEYMVEAANELGRVFTRAFLAIKDSSL